jgi:hypothetical protein
MVVRTAEALSALYELDETAWLETIAGLIREGKTQELDFAHLQEYLTDMAKRDKREVQSRLVTSRICSNGRINGRSAPGAGKRPYLPSVLTWRICWKARSYVSKRLTSCPRLTARL